MIDHQTRIANAQPDWNPAIDDQVMARVWRMGQLKPVFIYRSVSGIQAQMISHLDVTSIFKLILVH